VAKELCKIKKKLKKDPKAFAEMLEDPRFVCDKCGLAARKKKYVCEARKIAPVTELRVA